MRPMFGLMVAGASCSSCSALSWPVFLFVRPRMVSNWHLPVLFREQAFEFLVLNLGFRGFEVAWKKLLVLLMRKGS